MLCKINHKRYGLSMNAMINLLSFGQKSWLSIFDARPHDRI